MSITSKVLLANGLLPTSLHGNEDGACGLTRTRPGTDTHTLPMRNYVIAGVGNYLIADPTNLGNFMIADTYIPDFLEWMSGCILARLRVGHGDRVLDVGCGTGLYARRLAEHTESVVCLDPSAGMLEQLPDDPRLVAVQASAEDLVSGSAPLTVDRFAAIVVKEAIHHVTDRVAVIAGLARLLAPGGRLLVVMLPKSIEYPLFQAAHYRFRELQPDPEAIAAAMGDAGLTVALSYDDFPLMFPTERYIAMVHNRYLSLLSTFDDEEIAGGVAEIRRRYPGEHVEFRDRFAFVLGIAPEPQHHEPDTPGSWQT